MKNEFIGFYVPTKEMLKAAWNSKETLFIFDTNILINLYSYQSSTLNDFFSILEYLGDRIWLPHQVGLEYQNKRLDIKKQEKQKFQNIYKNLDDILSVEAKISQQFRRGRFPNLDLSTEELFKEIKSAIETFKISLNECDKSQPHIRTHDEIREKLDIFFKNRIGKAYTKKELEALYEEGEYRYEKKIQPGFEDKKKDGDYSYRGAEYKRKFGDLILWKQIIDKAKEGVREEKIKNVIFITDDEKEDWWYCMDQNGRKAIGPHANLTHEIIDESGISLFYMYNTTSFFEDAKDILSNIRIQDSSINEIEEAYKVEKQFLRQKNEELSDKNEREKYESLKSSLMQFIEQQECEKQKNEKVTALDVLEESIKQREIRKQNQEISQKIIYLIFHKLLENDLKKKKNLGSEEDE